MLTVLICAHNPRKDVLAKTLAALRGQTLSCDQWELLIVDNGSDEALAQTLDLGWHSRARVVREDELGLTPARLRGFAEASGELMVQVDDDNVLAEDDLARAAAIFTERPYVGAFGGLITQVFEREPPPWTQPYHVLLGWQDFPRDIWACAFNRNLCAPCGAGMCIRREVAEAFAKGVAENPFRRSLGRRGRELSSGEDTDLALCACDLGLATGLFRELRMQHLIPPARLEKDYLLTLSEKLALAGYLLPAIRNPNHRIELPSRVDRLASWYRRQKIDPLARAFELARLRARDQARIRLAEVRAENS